MLTAKELEKSYTIGSDKLTVLRDVNLRIAVADLVAIVGPSGSGKTTLLGILAGLDNPSQGSVRIDGTELGTLSEDERARFRRTMIGFVFQSFQLIPSLSALENVQVPLQLRGDRNSKARAEDILGRVGLGDRLNHYPAQLSGGEQQRVAIGRAFVGEPKILFADEPTGNLDAATGKSIVELLIELNRECGTTLVLATHDSALAAAARRRVYLADGSVAKDSKAQCHS